MGLARAARGRDAGYASACRQTLRYAALLAERLCSGGEARRPVPPGARSPVGPDFVDATCWLVTNSGPPARCSPSDRIFGNIERGTLLSLSQGDQLRLGDRGNRVG